MRPNGGGEEKTGPALSRGVQTLSRLVSGTSWPNSGRLSGLGRAEPPWPGNQLPWRGSDPAALFVCRRRNNAGLRHCGQAAVLVCRFRDQLGAAARENPGSASAHDRGCLKGSGFRQWQFAGRVCQPRDCRMRKGPRLLGWKPGPLCARGFNLGRNPRQHVASIANRAGGASQKKKPRYALRRCAAGLGWLSYGL